MANYFDLIVLAISLACFEVALSCDPPDCDHPDCGTCGNACCMMDFKLAVAPDVVYETILSNFKAGGPDKQYKFVNSTDMRQLKLPGGVQYVLRGVHNTSNSNDTLNMVVTSNSSKITIVKAFSISQTIYCDKGQNYKNLVGFIKGLAQLYADKVTFGCTNSTT